MSLTALRICVLVEATAPMGHYFPELRREWLAPLLRGAKAAHGNLVEFGLIMYRTVKFSDFVVQRSKWTTDVDDICAWAENAMLTGGGFQATALAEGLEEMVYMCKSSHNFSGKTLQCHCILLATSDPSRAPIFWPYPSESSHASGNISFLQLAMQLKANHNITMSMMQGGGNAILRDMFRKSSNYKEDRHLQTAPHLYVHISGHWAEAVQWLVEKHGPQILPKPGIKPPNPAANLGIPIPPGVTPPPHLPPAAVSAQSCQTIVNGGGLQRATGLPQAALHPQQAPHLGVLQGQQAAQQQQQPMIGLQQQQAPQQGNLGMQQVAPNMAQPGAAAAAAAGWCWVRTTRADGGGSGDAGAAGRDGFRYAWAWGWCRDTGQWGTDGYGETSGAAGAV